jgi:hypothetical protein
VHILWVGKAKTAGGGGDEIYDRKIIQALRRHHQVDQVSIPPNPRLKRLVNALRGLPLYRDTYYSKRASREIHAALQDRHYDGVVFSWEPLDVYFGEVDQPSVMILHNITSDAIVQIFPNNALSRWFASLLSGWERRTYHKNPASPLVVLSKRDREIASTTWPKAVSFLAAPGAPPVQSVDRAASVAYELVVSGTYEWKPKRRDVCRLAKELADLGQPIPVLYDLALPPKFTITYPANKIADGESARALRFGVIPDRFSSGYKLKAMHYIATGCIVISFCDILKDFEDIQDSALFIHQVRHAREIENVFEQIRALPAKEVAERFERFQRRCAARFDWDQSAAEIVKALEFAQTYPERSSQPPRAH